MTEKNFQPEMCANCPNRSKIAQLLSRVAHNTSRPEDCEGAIKVSHGQIVTQVRDKDEPSPPQKTWNSVVGSYMGERRYNRTEWTSEDLCGRDAVEPREHEVPYDPSELVHVNEKGQRFAAFILGSGEEIQSYRATQAIMEVLNATSERQD